MTDTGTITRLLDDVERGRDGARDELVEVVYGDLKKIAAKHLGRDLGPGMAGATLQPTALVHDAYLRLVRQRQVPRNRAQFFAIATKVILRVLMDYHRSRKADKRGGDAVRVSLEVGVASPDAGAEIPALVEALGELGRLDPRKTQVVELRVLWGLSMPEVAETLGLSLATVERDWSFSRKWLATRLRPGD